MKITSAPIVRALKKGKRIRRMGWPLPRMVYVNKNGILDNGHILGRDCISLTLEDLTADDWVVWEEEDF